MASGLWKFKPDRSPVTSLLRPGAADWFRVFAVGMVGAFHIWQQSWIGWGKLDFLVRTADFYGVSCDYLLGRSPERTGATLLVDDLPEADVLGKENRMRGGSILPTLNKRLMINSLNIVFSLLERIGDTKLTKSLSLYLMMDIYLAFRMLYELNPKNLSTLFVVDKARYPYLADAQRLMQRADLSQLMLQLSKDLPGEKTLLSTEQLQANYPLFTSSLLNLIKNVEVTLEQT